MTKQISRDNIADVIRYYRQTESRLGYDLFLRGTKHFGLFRPGDSAWKWSDALRRMEDRLGDDLALPSDSHVLDAGCGVGDVARRLATRRGYRVTGIDILTFNIAVARRRAKRHGLEDQVSFRVMNYAALDFTDGTFDGAYTMETLVHAADATAVLIEFYRVLKQGGRLVLFEYSHSPEREMLPAAVKAFRRVNEVAAMPSYQRFDHGVLEGLLKEVGFNSIAVEDITAQMLPMVRCFALIGRVPYFMARVFGFTDKAINAMSAVEFWRYRRYFRYNIYTANK
jgi:sterol 24-C-methyltransferase